MRSVLVVEGFLLEELCVIEICVRRNTELLSVMKLTSFGAPVLLKLCAQIHQMPKLLLEFPGPEWTLLFERV